MKENKYICTNRTVNYKKHVESVINKYKKTILDFFEVEDNGKFHYIIYIYDTLDELKSRLQERGFKEDPAYMCACFKDEDASINFYEPSDEENENEWTKDEYDLIIFHELIHAIEYTIYGQHPEWLCEGIAKYLDGTYSKGIKWLLQNYINKIPVPKMQELEEEFGLHEYDSYDYAYIMVSYLLETMGKKDFLKIIHNSKEIKKISLNLVNKAIDYYKEYYL